MKSIRRYDNPADAGYAESVLSGAGITSIVADEYAGSQPGFYLRVDPAETDRALGLLGDDGGLPVEEDEGVPVEEPAPAVQSIPFFAVCRQCGARWELSAAESSARRFNCPDCSTAFPILNIDAIPDVWESGSAFPQPKWKTVTQIIQQSYTREEQPEMYTQAALQWVRHIRAVAGKEYSIYQSKNFIILTVGDKSAGRDKLAVCESSLAVVRALLGPVAWHWTNGKHVSLLFDSETTYYRYYSCFIKDDAEVARSGGVFLNRGYCHTAIPPMDHSLGRGLSNRSYSSSELLAMVLAHEFTHLSLAEYDLPRWLNEGLAVNAENAASGRRGVRWRDTLSASHDKAWTEETLQGFWRGKTFNKPASQEVSYSLAEIMVANMLQDFGGKMADFVRYSAREDAGEAAARAHLGVSLGAMAAEFLGPGNWTPNPSR